MSVIRDLMRPRTLTGMATFIAAITLSGCSGGNLNDLHTYIAQVKQKYPGQIEPLPEIAVFESYTYKVHDLRSPFDREVRQTLEQEDAQVAAGNGLTPDLNRPRELLEEYPLDSLRMVGTLEQQQRIWAIIKATDGTIHRVVAGNFMGQNHGKILEISEHQVDLVEIIPNGLGGWQERTAGLALGGEQ